MEQDFITGLYESINGKRIGSEDDFRKALKDSTFAKGIYESINGKRIGTFDQFMQAIGGENQDAQTYENKDSQPPQQEPNFNYQPKSQTPLELLANRPTPLIDKKGKSYYKLDDILSKAEQKVQDEHDNLFEYLGKKITGTASNLLKFGIGPGAGAMSWGLAEAKRSAEEKVRVGAAEKERKSLINSINPNDVEAASYEDLYKDIYDEVGDETTAVRKANIAIKQHANRVNEITQSYYDRLKGKEKKAADDLMNGLQTEPLEAPSEDFNNWIDLVDKNSAQSKELNLHTDQYKEALTGILNVIGEAKNNELSEEEMKAVLHGYVTSLPYNSPLKTKAQELYESSMEHDDWIADGIGESILYNTLAKLSNTIEAGLEVSKWLGGGLSKMFKGFDDSYPLNTKGMSDFEKAEALKSSNRAIVQALIDPSSKYTGAISEQVVDKNGRRLVVKDGKVIDIRRPDGTKIFKPTQVDIKIAESYDPEKDVAREDYRGKSIAYQAGQVISDMAPMIIIGAVSGGTGAAAGATTRGQVLGSALISAGDYYQEGLDATGSVGQAALYAGFTAPMIGYVESKIGNIEAKLGRSIIGAERQGIFEAIKKEGKLVAQQGIESYVKGPGAMARAVKALKKAGEIGNDIKDELIEEVSNFPIEFVGQYISGMDPGPAPKEELEATAILTPLVTLALGGAKLMFDNQRDIDELVGYAALNKDHFEALGQQWIDSSKTDKEKSERTKDFEAKKAAVNEVHDTFNYIDENDFTPKQKDSLLELSFEKARAIYRQNISNSAKTKADLALKIEAIDNKMSTIMNSETKAADTYLNDEEVVAEPSLITTPKIETQLEKGVDEPKVVEPAPVLGAEFDNFLATEGINLETEVSLGDVESRMTNAEYIDIKELNTKSDKLYQVWDKVDQDSRLTPETKEALKSKLENLITKLETYELATTDEVSTTTEGGAAKGVRIIGTKKIEKPSRFEVTPERIAKQKATRVTDKNGNEFGGVFEYKGGKLSVQTKNGTIPVDQNTLQFKQSIKENDTVVGAEVYDPSTGHTFTIGNRELALDMALKAKEMEFGVAEEPLFEEVFSEVTSKTTTTKRLVREQPNTTPTTTITVEAPKIEVTTDTSQQSNKVEPDNTTTKADIENKRKDIISRKSTPEEKFNFLENIPDGTIIKNKDGDEALVIRKKITKRGNEVYELVTLYINEDGSWERNDSGVNLVERKSNGEYNLNAELPQIFTSDIEIILPNDTNYNSELVNLTTTQNDIKNETSKSSSKSGVTVTNLSNLDLKNEHGSINTGSLEQPVLPKGKVNKVIAKDKNGNDIRVSINYDKLKDILLGRNGKYIFRAMQGRFFVIAKVGDFYLPFYISSSGTSGKNEGEWYPFFGYNNWLVKGKVTENGKMLYGSKVDDITKLLNENLQIPAKYFTQFGQIIGDGGTPAKPEKIFYDLNDDLPYESWFVEYDRNNSNYTEEDFIIDRTGFNPSGVVNDGKGSAYSWINGVLKLINGDTKISKNETSKSGGNTTSTTSNSTEDVLAKQEDELETILEPLGKTQKEREGQIEKFFTSKDSGVDPATAKEQAKLTSRVWQAVAKYFGKRNKQSADEYITSKLKLIGKTTTSKVGKAKFQIIGEKGAKKLSEIENYSNLILNLDLAKRLEQSNVNAKSIRLQTGWERGKDGFWRYEIDDNLNVSKIEDALDEWGYAQDQANDEGGEVEDYFTGDDVFSLVDIIEAKSELLVSYPVLVEYTVELDSEISSNASVNTDKKIIRLNPNKVTNLKSSLLHEIQHVIQMEEGHSPGSSSYLILSEYLPFINMSDNSNPVASKLFKMLAELNRQVDNYSDSELAKYIAGPVEKSIVSKLGKALSVENLKELLPEDKFKEFVEKYKISKDSYASTTVYDLYKKSAGEVEARNVSKRSNLAAVDRKETPLADTEGVPREEQIILDSLYNSFESFDEDIITPEMADQLSANLLTHLDTMIEERTNPSKVAKALKENRGLTKSAIADQVQRLKEVRDLLIRNGRVSYQETNKSPYKGSKMQDTGVNRGALIEYAKNEMIMVALESPNVSTAIHELYHVFQVDLSPEEVQTVVDSYNEAFGTNHTLSDLNGKVATDVEEWGARLWEKYFENGRKLTEKEVPNQKARNAFQNIFDKFTDWMKGVYNGVISYTNTDGSTREVNVSKPVQDMFDKILGITPMESVKAGAKTATKSEDDLSFLRDMEDFDFENLKTACVKL